MELRMPWIMWHDHNKKEKWEAGWWDYVYSICWWRYTDEWNGWMRMETRCFTAQKWFIDRHRHVVFKDKITVKYKVPKDVNIAFVMIYTHQFSFLHALHNHEEDLLRLAFCVIECLLNSHQQLVSDVIINQAASGVFMGDILDLLPED